MADVVEVAEAEAAAVGVPVPVPAGVMEVDEALAVTPNPLVLPEEVEGIFLRVRSALSRTKNQVVVLVINSLR